jgi:hypothetical protein
MREAELKYQVFAHEPPVPDVHDNNHHGYICSKCICSLETCISCPQLKFLVFFPSLLLIGREPKRTAKISRLPLLPKDFLICCVVSIVTHYRPLSNNILLRKYLSPVERHSLEPIPIIQFLCRRQFDCSFMLIKYNHKPNFNGR